MKLANIYELNVTPHLYCKILMLRYAQLFDNPVGMTDTVIGEACLKFKASEISRATGIPNATISNIRRRYLPVPVFRNSDLPLGLNLEENATDKAMRHSLYCKPNVGFQ